MGNRQFVYVKKLTEINRRNRKKGSKSNESIKFDQTVHQGRRRTIEPG